MALETGYLSLSLGSLTLVYYGGETHLIEKEDRLPLNGWACSCSDNRMVEARLTTSKAQS